MPCRVTCIALKFFIVLLQRGGVASAAAVCSQETLVPCWAMPSGVSIGCPSEQGEAICFPKSGFGQLRVATRGHCKCVDGWCAQPPSASATNAWSCTSNSTRDLLQTGEISRTYQSSELHTTTSSSRAFNLPFTATETGTTSTALIAERSDDNIHSTTTSTSPRKVWHAELQWLEFDGHSYLLVDELATWDEQRIKCESLAAHMVTINSSAENQFVISLMPPADSVIRWPWLWIGMTRVLLDSWVDGSPMIYKNWADGQPTNRTNDRLRACGEIFRPTGDNWHDSSCSEKSRTVCERDASLYFMIPLDREDANVAHVAQSSRKPSMAQQIGDLNAVGTITTTESRFEFTRVVDMTRVSADGRMGVSILGAGDWPPVCDSVCTFFGEASTCKDSIRYNYFQRFNGASNVDACTLAQHVVAQNCPMCAECTVPRIGCKDEPWRYMQPTTHWPQASTTATDEFTDEHQLYSARGTHRGFRFPFALIGVSLSFVLLMLSAPMLGLACLRRRHVMLSSKLFNAEQDRFTREWKPSTRSSWALSFESLAHGDLSVDDDEDQALL